LLKCILTIAALRFELQIVSEVEMKVLLLWSRPQRSAVKIFVIFGFLFVTCSVNLSVKTVSTYKARISEETGLLTVSDITRYAIVHHLLVS
jgi:hypothetical protein